ncbi:MAG: DEAD/DEAH box helicase [bacterium]
MVSNFNSNNITGSSPVDRTFIAKDDFATSDQTMFKDFAISADILRALEDLGFQHAFPIQAQAIPSVLEGRDIIGLAHTGTGKTAAFAIPAIQMVDANSRDPQVIVMCPTRELAVQVCGEAEKLTKYKTAVKAGAIYGGASIEQQISMLRRGVQIVVGTPGRLLDHLSRKTLKLDNIKMVVLDEADEMLNMGFREDIEKILQYIPGKHQTLLFSATMSPDILRLTKNYQDNPKMIQVASKSTAQQNIEQIYFEVGPSMKVDLLARLVDLHAPKRSIVFCNTKRRVDEVIDQLQGAGYPVDAIHGDISQMKRNKVIARFRKGDVTILVATDVAARGLDIQDVEAVFNYDIPRETESYVHRIGRTGRAGKTGRAFSFVTRSEHGRFEMIKRYVKMDIYEERIPSRKELEDLKLNKFLSTIKEVIEKNDLSKNKDIIARLTAQSIDPVVIAAALLEMTGLAKQKTIEPKFESSGRGDREEGDFRRSDRGPRRSFGTSRPSGRRDNRDNSFSRDRDSSFGSESSSEGGNSRFRSRGFRPRSRSTNGGGFSRPRPDSSSF